MNFIKLILLFVFTSLANDIVVDTVPDPMYTDINFFDLDRDTTSKYLKIYTTTQQHAVNCRLTSLTLGLLSVGVIQADNPKMVSKIGYGLAFGSFVLYMTSILYDSVASDVLMVATGQTKPIAVRRTY